MKVGRFKFKAEAGSIAPLALGLASLTLASILITASATSLYVLDRRLTSLAEFAALNEASNGMTAEAFIREGQVGGFIELRVESDRSLDSTTSEVQLCSTWVSPLPGLIPLSSRRVCGKGLARAG